MSDAAPDAVVRVLQDLPVGTITGWFGSSRYIATKSVYGAGRSVKFVAEELGGTGYISLNLYALSSGARLFPCEMSRAKVIAFVTGFHPDADGA